MRRRARRRSVSSCVSPGPRVPTPPPSRSRCCHIPRMRGRLYSSCASSTWSLPSALTACCAKMSRISCVRSTTRACERVLEVALLRRLELVVDDQRLRAEPRERLLQLLDLALADVGAHRRARAVLDDRADGLDAGGARELLHLGELLGVVGAGSEDRQTAARARAPWRRRRDRGVTRQAISCPAVCCDSAGRRSPRRTLELVNIASPSRGEDARSSSYVRGLDAATRPRTTTTPCSSTPGASCSPVTTTRCPRRTTCRAAIEDGWVVGLGATDMKGGVAVMIELARGARRAVRLPLLRARGAPGRRELAADVLRAATVSTPTSSSMLEPTDNTIQAGCLGNLNARLVFHGDERALGAAVARRQRDHARRRGARAARVARAARRRDRRARVPRGAQRDADRGRHRDERHPGARRGDPQLPLRAGPHAARTRRRVCASS